jgi:sec-independent protein translocase protein TatB
MFDFDASKILVLGIVALAVIPPKDLPRVLRTVGQYVGKMRRMASEFQGQFMDAMKEAEKAADLESVKKEFDSIEQSAKVDTSFDLDAAMRGDSTRAIEPPKSAEPVTSSATPQVVVEPEPAPSSHEPFSSEVVVKAPTFPEDPPPRAEARAPSAAP